MSEERTGVETIAGKRPKAVTHATPWLVAGLMVAVAALLLGYFRPWFPSPLHDPDAKPRPVAPRGELWADEAATIALFQQARKSVVHITSTDFRRELDRNLFKIEKFEGAGTGIVWDKHGHIVTNYHVIRAADKVIVQLGDGTTYPARYVGGTEARDIAVVKIEAPASELVPITVGSSSDLAVGQTVLAIGNPFGLDQTLTTGVISGLGREIPLGEVGSGETIRNVIQTDAAINPGNSGGPLLDSAGRLIGMNTAIYSPSGAYAGVGFAIAVDDINRIVPELIRTGHVEHIGLGIMIAGDETLQQLIEVGALPRPGVLVLNVVSGSGAAKAGIQSTVRTAQGMDWGDLIIAANDQRIEETAALYEFLEAKSAGEVVRLTVLRDGEQREIPVKLSVLSN